MDKDFAKAFAELEETAAWFERGEPDVEEGLKRFASAMEIASSLRTYLQDAQNRVNEIKALHAEGVEEEDDDETESDGYTDEDYTGYDETESDGYEGEEYAENEEEGDSRRDEEIEFEEEL